MKKDHHLYNPDETGIILSDCFPSEHNSGKAWRVLFSDGKVATKLSRHLEVINESR